MSRMRIVYEPPPCAYAVHAFDARGARWVAWELLGPARGLFVGRVNSRFGPVDAQLVPGTVGLSVSATLGIGARGTAILAWRFSDPYAAWSSKPWGTAAVAASLAVVASAAADRAGLADWLVHDGIWAQALTGAAAANILNNLPAFLVALPHTSGSPQTLALLIGVNLGPTVLVTGSLAGLLWLESSRRAGLAVDAPDYARVGLLAGVPALVAAVAVLAATV